MTWLFALPLSYLIGAIPTSFWVGRAFHGVDLRHEGSGNLGATNTFRVLGWKAALPVVLFDVFKGFAPVAFATAVVDQAGVPAVLRANDLLGLSVLCGLLAVIGHVFSVFVGFRGGKGVATSAGLFLALAPAAVGLGLLVFIAVVRSTRIVSLGSIASAGLLPLLIWLTPHRGGSALVMFSVALATFVVWAHRANIARLVRGEENRFGRGS